MIPAKEQLEKSIRVLCDQAFPLDVWEDVLLPARVSGYRSELLDEVLAQGDLFWRITSDKGVSFHLYEDINWDYDLELSNVLEELEGNEKIIYEALLKRGASFMQRLSPLLSGVSPYDFLLNLMEKGMVTADSFVPVRQWHAWKKQKNITIRQKVNARVKAMSAGRWEVLRPLKELTVEEQLERLFDKVIIVCRETMQGVSWSIALETLRVWEYTARVRRGYFIEGLSGIQFIRTKDFEGVMTELVHPLDQVIWISAIDIAQPWGKSLPHMKDGSFHNVSGTAVALRAGSPMAVFERQGKVLRIFDSCNSQEVLRSFSQDFKTNRIFPKLKRITVKEYPIEAVDSLIGAGFVREMQDYVLYR